jgi:hypothetical protein
MYSWEFVSSCSLAFSLAHFSFRSMCLYHADILEAVQMDFILALEQIRKAVEDMALSLMS